MSYQKEREEAINILTKEGMQLADILIILRNANTYQRLLVNDCNIGLTKKEIRKMKSIEKRLTDLVNKYEGFKIKLGGDVRGFTTKLILPSGYYNSWGGKDEGYGITTRYY